MNTKNPIKHYLSQSVRTNRKWVFFAWISILAFGLILATIRVLPPIASLFSEHILGEFVVDLPVKTAFLVIPLILIVRSKSHKKWQEANPDVPITKKNFSTALYLEIFLSIFLGVPALIITWIVAGLIDPVIVERIFITGILASGEMFLWVWLMTTLIYTLQFTPLVKVGDGSVLVAAGLLGSLWVVVSLQNTLWYSINEIGVPIPLVVAIYMFVALLILVIGWVITAKVYEKVDL